MPKYRVYGVVKATKYLGEFEADTPEEAEDMALSEEGGPVSLCHQCNSEMDDPEISEAVVELADPAAGMGG